MSTNELTGQALLWAGFLGAALASVYRLEVEDQPWTTIPWGFYGISMVVGVVGIVFLRRSAASAVQHTERVEAEFATLTTSLADIRSAVGEILEGHEDPREIVRLIDERCVERFGDFADARNALVQRFGLQGFAEVMTQFSSAERFVNRAWSAAADGYINEATASLRQAETYLNQASQAMDAHTKS